MKGIRLWVVATTLAAGCTPLALAPDLSTPRRVEERGVAGSPVAREETSTRVAYRRRALPESLMNKTVEFKNPIATALPRIARRLSEALRAEVVMEERGIGAGEHAASSQPPAPIPVSGKRTVGEVLDLIALHSEYEWEWEDGEDSRSDRLILYRDPLRPRREVPTSGWGTKEEWRIDPVRHGTLRGVLEEWTARAGWTLVWEAEEVDYAVQAPAVYLGTFDSAVDALLRETKGRRMLVPTLWRANRYLTVREAG